MIITPIIIPHSSAPDPCANCDCPCHDGPDAPFALAILAVAAASGFGAWLEWSRDFLGLVYDRTTGEHVGLSVLGGMIGALAAIVAILSVSALVYAVRTLWRAVRP